MFVFFIGVGFAACSNPDQQQELDNFVMSSDTAANESKLYFDKEEDVRQNTYLVNEDTSIYFRYYLDSNNIISLPFGCDILVNHKFPKWRKEDISNENTLPHEKEFQAVSLCFNQMNSSGQLTAIPFIKKIEKIEFGNRQGCNCIDSIYPTQFRYQLPNMGPYMCYYLYDSKGACGNCMEYGRLLLYDFKSQKAKILNIFMEIGGDQNVSYRQFYIEKDKTIRIFEGACYDDGCSLLEKCQIEILDDGQVQINQK